MSPRASESMVHGLIDPFPPFCLVLTLFSCHLLPAFSVTLVPSLELELVPKTLPLPPLYWGLNLEVLYH